jgi:hypothetical protein
MGKDFDRKLGVVASEQVGDIADEQLLLFLFGNSDGTKCKIMSNPDMQWSSIVDDRIRTGNTIVVYTSNKLYDSNQNQRS